MALTVALSQVSGNVLGGKRCTFLMVVTNTGSSSVSLTSAQVMETTESDAVIEQPNIMASNQPPGVGNQTIVAGGTYSVTFNAVFPGLVLSGTSPQAPGGAAPGARAQTADANFVLSAIVQASDGSVGLSAPLSVTVLAPDSNFAPPEGGALWLSQGANAVNFITLA